MERAVRIATAAQHRNQRERLAVMVQAAIDSPQLQIALEVPKILARKAWKITGWATYWRLRVKWAESSVKNDARY